MAVSIALILLLGLMVDHFFKRVRLPGLLGLLLIGIVFGPHVLNLIQPELLRVSADLRMVALIILLLRAGLQLRRDTLNRVGGTTLLLAVIPALFEGVTVTLAAPSLLGITFLEGAILGAILAAVSLAVVVPSMLDFIHRGSGVAKGIPTLILSASSVSVVFVIVLFSALLGFRNGHGEGLWWQLLKIPQSILLGIGIGVLAGFILVHLFRRLKPRATKMTLTVVSVSILLTWLEEVLQDHLTLSALLAVMTMGLVLLEKLEVRSHVIAGKLAKVWIFAEIVLFVLVGAQLNIHVAWDTGLAGLLLLLLALAGRGLGTWLSLAGSHLDHRERRFCVVANIPKATVQAAIGALPLEAGVASGEIILAVAVLSILFTAPLGAIGIQYGERWLTRDPQLSGGKPGI